MINAQKTTVAILGGPSNRYLWILADKHHIDIDLYNELIFKAKQMSYAIENLEKVKQQ